MAKILIIDDDAALAKTVKNFLVIEKHEADICASGSDAVSKLAAEQFDLILLDWDLPDMSGLEICKQFRERGGITPILMLTGRTDIDEKESALDAGADDYLTKPFHIKELGARVRSLVRRSAVAATPTGAATGGMAVPDARVCVVCSGIFPSQDMETCPNDGGTTIAICTQQVVGKQFGTYTATKLLGVGAWSEVYEGTAPNLPLTAIKILHSHLCSDPINITRFEREAKILLGIKHESIAQVIGGGRTFDGRPYIIMEFVNGTSIEKLLRTRGSMPVAHAVNVIAKACVVLDAAHGNGYIHRDIKPSNIFLTNDLVPQLKLMDFGLAKAVTADGATLASLTAAGETLGTPAYMSPEQVRGERLDRRSDIYALGLVLYEMISGFRAIPGNTAFEVMTNHLGKYPPSISTVSPTVKIPAELEDVIFKAIAKDAEDRYQSAGEFRQHLLNVLSGRRSMPAV